MPGQRRAGKLVLNKATVETLCLPCVLSTLCSSHFASHLATNLLFCHTVPNWNNLPSSVVSCSSLVLFQRSVRDHFAVDMYLYGLT